MVPAALFYEDALLASAKDVNLVKWSKLPNPNIPILFRGCNTEDDTQDEGAVSATNLVSTHKLMIVLVQCRRDQARPRKRKVYSGREPGYQAERDCGDYAVEGAGLETPKGTATSRIWRSGCG